jgi:hypothetical protein
VISWRYHLVTIVAVFLALAIGLLIGTAFLNDRLVADLRARTESIRQDRDAMASELRALRRLAEIVAPFLVERRLEDLDVVILTYAGSDGESLARARAAIERAGGRVITTVELQPALSSPSPEDLPRLAAILDLPIDTDAGSVAQEATRRLARRLADGPVDGADDDDLLARLVLDGFLRATDPEIDTVRDVGGPDQAFVVVAGSSSDPLEAPSAIVVGLTQVLTDRGATVAVVENVATSSSAIVAAVRERVTDGRGPVITVDDVADPLGAAALVLGLQRALISGQGGDYGLAEDAELLPPPPA